MNDVACQLIRINVNPPFADTIGWRLSGIDVMATSCASCVVVAVACGKSSMLDAAYLRSSAISVCSLNKYVEYSDRDTAMQ